MGMLCARGSAQDGASIVGGSPGSPASPPYIRQLTPEEISHLTQAPSANTSYQLSGSNEGQLPDLVALGLGFALQPNGLGEVGAPALGDEIYLKFYFANIGNGSADKVQIETRIDGVVNCTFPGNFTVPPNTTWMFICSPPWRATEGFHTFEGLIDPNNTVPEIFEYNNTTRYEISTFSLPPVGLRLWLRAGAGLLQSNSRKVSVWTDLSGNGNDAVQKGGDLKPEMIDNVDNGGPAIRFYRTYLETGALAVRGTSPFTMFCVLRYAALPDTSSVPLWNGLDNGGGDGYGLGRLSQNGRIYSGWTSGGTGGGDSVQLGSLQINSATYDGSLHKVYVNGRLLSRTSYDASNFANGTFTIGKQGGTSRMLNPFNGDIAEIIVYERALSDADRKSVEAYLEWRHHVASGIPDFNFGFFSRFIDFSNVFITSSRTYSVSVSNWGGSDLIIDTIRSSNPVFYLPIAHDTIKAGRYKPFDIVYAPARESADTAKIVFVHNGESSPDTLTVAGRGDPKWLHLSSDHVEFSPTLIGSQQTYTIAMRSTLPRPVAVTTTSSDSTQCSVPVSVAYLGPFEQFSYRDLVFRPSLVGTFSGEVIFASSDSLPPETLKVRGSGVAPYTESVTTTSWQWLNPFPQGNDLIGVTMVDTNTILTVGAGGTILRTTDGGSHWRVQNYVEGNSGIYTDVKRLSGNVALVVGSGRVLRTTNNGDSWKTVSTPPNFVSPYLPAHVSFGNERVGTIAFGGNILRTSDAGVSWSIGAPAFNDLGFQNVASIGNDTVVVVCASFALPGGYPGVILRSIDGGRTWHDTLVTQAGRIVSISMLDHSFGMAIGRYEVFRTRDGGSSWSQLPIPTNVALLAFTDVKVLDTSTYVIGTYSDNIVRSSDGGTTWRTIVLDSSEGLNSLYFMDKRNGVAVGSAGKIFQSSDGGLTWRRLVKGSTAFLSSAYFPSSRIGYAAGSEFNYPGSTSILRTTDSGLDWTEMKLFGYRDPSGIHFSNDCNGIVLDGLGFINRTSDAGVTWVSYRPSDVQGLYALSFLDSVNGAMTGINSGQARILLTSDGGANWANSLSGVTGIPLDVSFVDSSTIVVVGGSPYGALMLRSTNRGETWNSISNPGVQYCTHVSFADRLNGMAIGFGQAYTSVVLRTSTGGETWTIQSGVLKGQVYGITMFDRNRAFALTYGDQPVYKTEDGGLSWTPDPLPTTNYLSTMQSVHSGNGGGLVFAFGGGGTILCNAVSPLSPKTWTGAVDSNWNDDGNWKPAGAPRPFDSVIIAAASNHPALFHVQQQVVVAALTIESGGRLTITDSLSQFVVKGSVSISGTMEIEPNAQTNVIVGGSWSETPGGLALTKGASNVDRGFVAAQSTVLYTGRGTYKNTSNAGVHNVAFDSLSSMAVQSNLHVENNCILTSDVTLLPPDSMFIANPDPNSLTGHGKVVRGTIRRRIDSTKFAPYRFESESTYVRFAHVGTIPTVVTMTTLPDTNPLSFGTQWVEVPSSYEDSTNTVVANNIPHFSKWLLGTPRPRTAFPKVEGETDFVQAVRRVYEIRGEGGLNFRFRLALRYEQSEVPAGVDESSLRLFYLADGSVIDKSGKQTEGIPKEFALEQNYPNPFNPSTVIRYQLPVQSSVSLKIYNLLGQEVRTLVEENENAGYKSVEWFPGGEPSGVYYYRLRAKAADGTGKAFVRVKKMLLIH